jgi:hypothetical protein
MDIHELASSLTPKEKELLLRPWTNYFYSYAGSVGEMLIRRGLAQTISSAVTKPPTVRLTRLGAQVQQALKDVQDVERSIRNGEGIPFRS